MGSLLTDTLERHLVKSAWPERRAVSPDFLADKDDQILKTISELETQFGGPKALDEALEMLEWNRRRFWGYLDNRLVENYKIRMIVQSKYEKPTPEEIEDYRQQKISEGAATELYWLSHILFVDGEENADSSDADNPATPRERALAALIRLERGENFPLLAAEISDDPNTRLQGGQLGRFTYEELSPVFQVAIAEMKVGDVSMPIEGAVGIHLLRLDRRRTAAGMLRIERFNEARQSLIAELKTENAIEIVDPEMKILHENWLQTNDGAI